VEILEFIKENPLKTLQKLNTHILNIFTLTVSACQSRKLRLNSPQPQLEGWTWRSWQRRRWNKYNRMV